MVSLAAYKAALAILLLLSAASTGSVTYYFRQKTSDLNNQITDLNSEVSSSRSQVSNLNSNLESLVSQISQLISLNVQLQDQIAQLESQVADLAQRLLESNTTLVSSGVLSFLGGEPLFVSFTVPSTAADVRTNVTAYMSATPGGNQIPHFTVALLNQTEYDLFQPWSDSPRTWSSPQVDSISALVDIPFSGNWYLAFESAAGWGSEQNVSYTVNLVTTKS